MDTSSTAARVAVFTTPSMQAQVQALNLPATLCFPIDSVSMETQQMDEENARQALLKHHERLRELLKAEKPTGAAHLFVLDPNELAVGAADSHATLQALADSQLGSSDRVAAALLPASGALTDEGRAASTATRELLADMNVVALESAQDVLDWVAKV